MQPFEECPRFDSCSCNACPLDLVARTALPGDEPCRAVRRTRVAIAERYAVPGGGLLPREIRKAKRRAAWEALPEAVKAVRLARLKSFLSPVKAKKSTAP